MAGNDGGDCRRIGAGSSDSELLQRFHKRSLCIVCRRLGKVLFLLILQKLQRTLLRNSAQVIIPHLSVFLRGIDRKESVENHLGGCRRKGIFSRLYFYGIRFIAGRRHTAGRKALPNQLIETELFSGKMLLYRYRCSCNIRRADGLVRILCVLIGIGGIPCGRVRASVLLRNIGTGCLICFFGNTRRIRTQVGNQSDCPLPGKRNSLI